MGALRVHRQMKEERKAYWINNNSCSNSLKKQLLLVHGSTVRKQPKKPPTDVRPPHKQIWRTWAYHSSLFSGSDTVDVDVDGR